ncbi:MAG: hypothetical protein R3Y23_04165 [Bacillota bacterium]
MDILKQSILPINDDTAMRDRLVKLYETAKHSTAVIWSIEIARHLIDISGVDLSEEYNVIMGLSLLFKYMNLDPKEMPLLNDNLDDIKSVKTAKYEITPALLRSTALNIHSSVFTLQDVTKRVVIQVVAQAIASPFLHDHCMNCSDYAINAITTFYRNDLECVHEERKWQFHCLSRVINHYEEKNKDK